MITIKNSLFIPVITLLLIGCENNKIDKTNNEPVEITKYSYDDFEAVEGIYQSGINFDDTKMIYTSDKSGIMNLYSMPILGGEATQLTFSETETYLFEENFPTDNRVLFSHDNEGDENNHLYVLSENGKEVDITPFEGSKASFSGFDRTREHIYIKSNHRNPKVFDVYKMAIVSIDDESYVLQMIYQNDNAYGGSGISDDEKTIAVVDNKGKDKSDIHIIDIASNKITATLTSKDNSTYDSPVFTSDGAYLYYITNDGSDFTYVNKYEIATGKSEEVFKDKWNVTYFELSHNEQYWQVMVNEDGKTYARIFNVVDNKEITFPSLGADKWAFVIKPSVSEKAFRLNVRSTTLNAAIYSYKVGEEPIFLAGGFTGKIKEEDMVSPTVIRFESFDGEEIPANFYVPKDASAGNRVPCMLFIHGGPGGQSSINYSKQVQYYVNQGYAILQVNNRGSSGYGKRFYALDDQKHGEDDLQDCIESKKFLASSGVIDMDKVGIMGGSYGGCMTMAALCFAPDEFKVGVNIFGVTNWIRTLRSIPPHWEAYRKGLYEEIGDPNSNDSVRLKKISPIFHASNVTKPLMVIQGANDVRVLQVESDEIVKAVEANGVPVEYVLFDDEGHGFRKKENQRTAAIGIVKFLDEHLK